MLILWILGKMARTTDIYCTVCNSKSVIERSERIHSEFTRYYCACKNPLCGHRFVMNMEFGHTTRASKLTKDKLLELVLGKLSDEEKANLRKILVMKKAARNSGFCFRQQVTYLLQFALKSYFYFYIQDVLPQNYQCV